MSFCKFSTEDFLCRYLKKQQNLFPYPFHANVPFLCSCHCQKTARIQGISKLTICVKWVIIWSFLFVLWKSSHWAQNIQMLFQEPYHCPPQKLCSKILIILYSYKKLKLLKPLKCPDNHLLHLFCGF